MLEREVYPAEMFKMHTSSQGLVDGGGVSTLWRSSEQETWSQSVAHHHRYWQELQANGDSNAAFRWTKSERTQKCQVYGPVHKLLFSNSSSSGQIVWKMPKHSCIFMLQKRAQTQSTMGSVKAEPGWGRAATSGQNLILKQNKINCCKQVVYNFLRYIPSLVVNL